jgi:hypothetical protein
VVFKTDADYEKLLDAEKERRRHESAEHNIILDGFIELINQLYVTGESVCN